MKLFLLGYIHLTRMDLRESLMRHLEHPRLHIAQGHEMDIGTGVDGLIRRARAASAAADQGEFDFVVGRAMHKMSDAGRSGQ